MFFSLIEKFVCLTRSLSGIGEIDKIGSLLYRLTDFLSLIRLERSRKISCQTHSLKWFHINGTYAMTSRFSIQSKRWDRF
jgi:hypothetical protein